MKKLQLALLLIAFAWLNVLIANAQSKPEYKLDMNSGRFVVKEINDIEFVGHSASGVIIKLKNVSENKSKRAEGLKLINGLGLVDNTGIGLNVEKSGSETVVQQISRNSKGEFIVMVPKGVTVVYEHSSPYGKTVKFKNIAGEIEAETNHSDVELMDVTGPLSINTVHGDIEGGFSVVNQSNPIAVTSAHGDIDLSMPKNTKANFKISTDWGEIYSDLDLDIQKNEGSMKQYGGNKVIGKLSGGGVSINISSAHGSIYLRGK